MTTAQLNKIKELQKEYVVTVLREMSTEVLVKASNGLTYKNFRIGPRGGLIQQGAGRENGNDLLKIIDNE